MQPHEKHTRLRSTLLLALALAPTSAVGTGPEHASSTDTPTAETVTTFEQAMDVLYPWLGAWTAVETHFDVSGHVIAEVKGTEETRWILNEHGIRRVYRSGGTAEAFEAQGTFTWNQIDKMFHGFWLDNRSANGPSTIRATWTPQTRTMVHELEHAQPDGRQVFRVVERFIDDDHRSATTYRVDGKKLVKVLEVHYTRSAPCPERQSTLRIINIDLE